MSLDISQKPCFQCALCTVEEIQIQIVHRECFFAAEIRVKVD